MIAHEGSRCVERTPTAVRAALSISSAVRGAGGSTHCGDVAYVLPLDSGRTAIVVLDVAGHGSARAQLAAILADAVTASLQRDGSPSVALSCANELLLNSSDESPYAVGFIALVHPALRTVIYASAGHDVAFAMTDDGRMQNCAQTGPMLGVALADNLCDAIFLIEPYETLVIATDGISDSRPPGSQLFFGGTGTAQAVARALRNGCDPAQAVIDAARAHEGGRQTDDVAVIVAGFDPRPSRSPQHRSRARTVHFETSR